MTIFEVRKLYVDKEDGNWNVHDSFSVGDIEIPNEDYSGTQIVPELVKFRYLAPGMYRLEWWDEELDICHPLTGEPFLTLCALDNDFSATK